MQWPIHDFLEARALTYWLFFQNNCMQMKKFWTSVSSLDAPMACLVDLEQDLLWVGKRKTYILPKFSFKIGKETGETHVLMATWSANVLKRISTATLSIPQSIKP